jgi:hypothetical protein
MANFNRQADNHKTKMKRRRREVNRMIAQMQAKEQSSAKPGALRRKIRELKQAMRYDG